LLLRNDAGKFIDVTSEMHAGGGDGWLSSAAFFDLENDGDLDLFLCGYVKWSERFDSSQSFPLAGVGRGYGPPTAFEGDFCILLRNDGSVFTDVSEPAGIRIRTFDLKAPMAKSLGVAPWDVDGDGFVDLAIANDTVPNFLFRNRGDGTFEEIAAQVGLDIADHTSSALFADFDNDGDSDVFLGRTLARSRYLVNEGGRFVDRSETLVAAALPALVSSISAVDYDGDGLLDVYLSTYAIDDDLQEDFLPPAARQEIGRRWKAGGHLFRDRPGPPNVLLRNLGEGKFGVAPNSGALEVWRNTFQSTWSDYDADGDMDVYLANDFAPNNLIRNDGSGVFTDVTAETGTADIGFGMGASWGDYDNDGAHDLYVTNMYSTAGRRITAEAGALGAELAAMARGNSLLRNRPGRFTRVSGLEPPALLVERAGWGWGSQFLDVDNDGDLDIHALSGYYTAPTLPEAQPDL
jgi:hypothetical protein